MTVAKIAGQACAFDQFAEQFLRERILTLGEITPIEKDRDTGDFPVAARRILATRQFLGESVCANNIGVGDGTDRKSAGAVATCVIQPEPGEIRQF